MKIRKFFLMMAVLVSSALLFTACPPEPPVTPPIEKPNEEVKYKEVKLFGNCTKSDYSADSWSFGNKVTLGATTKLNAAKLAVAGKQIIGIRARIDSEVDNFKVFLGKDYKNPEIVKDTTYSEVGWQYVLFDEPYDVTDEDIYIGWEGKTASLVLETARKELDGEMVKLDEDWVTMADFCTAIKLNDGQNYLTKMAWPLQAICVDGDYSQETRFYDVVIDGVNVEPYVVAGENQPLEMMVRNNALTTLTNIEVKATVGSNSNSATIPMLMNGQSAIVKLDIMQGEAQGIQDVTFEALLSDDQAPKNNTVTVSQRVYKDRSLSRNTVLIEQFTGQGCGYCPGGANAIKEAIADLGDASKVVWVVNHYGYVADDFTVSESETIGSRLGVPGAPTCDLNRALIPGISSLVWSPYNMTADILKTALDEPALADIKIESQYNADTREFTATVSGKCLASEAYITAIVSQNGMVATQKDYSNNKDETITDYVHNHAPRKFLTSAVGEKLTVAADGTYSKTFTYTVSPKVGKFDCKPEDMEFVAFIHGDIQTDSRFVFNSDWVELTTGKRPEPATEPAQLPMQEGPRYIPAKR